jgi:hypothetical protein
MVITAGGFDASLKSCEDWELWLRLLFGGVEVIPVYKHGAYYRQHPNSMSKNSLRMAQTQSEVLRRALRYIEANSDFVVRQGLDLSATSDAIRSRLMIVLLDAAYYARQQASYLSALHYYFLSMRQGRLNRGAVVGALKLFPHWVLRPIRASCQ